MSKQESTQSPSPAESRVKLQRARIRCAAQSCFVREGFHTASMATIAETAEMSPGLIYRYFENKNAIILDIIESQLQIAREKIRTLRAADDLGASLLEYFDKQDCDDEPSISAALFLEMSAESRRDPEIARAVADFDVMVRTELSDWMRRSQAEGGLGLAARTVPQRALALVMMIEGLKVRKAREPDIDRKELKKAIDTMLTSIVN